MLEEKGYHTLLIDTFNDPAKELESLDTLHEQRVDGVILIATVFTPQHHTALQNCTVPVVIVGQQFSGYSCVYHDDYNAIYTLTQLVLQKAAAVWDTSVPGWTTAPSGRSVTVPTAMP